ncbi:MAG: arginine--tRNA ligase [Clostridia bacterium]|nr:arginine--tRNA ligase [Clostridia bacterium]
MINFKEEIAKAISNVIEQEPKELANSIEIPKDSAQGDYAFPCFRLAKTLKKSTQMIAEDLKSKIKFEDDLVEKIEVAGGYLNFFVNKEILAKTVIEEIRQKQESYGKSNIGNGKNVIVEYSSPNIAKPFHIGHLRTTLIGNALYNTYKTLGYNTIRN